MKSITMFRDLKLEIDMIKIRMGDLEREDYALSVIEFNKINLEIYANRKHKLINEMAILQAMLDDKQETKKELLDKLKKLEGLGFQVAYKRFVEGKDLNQISKELKYSYKYIKNISCEMSKEIRCDFNVTL